MAINHNNVFNYKEATFDELIKQVAKTSLNGEYERKATLYCLTHSSLSQEEKEETIYELAEIYISTIIKKLEMYVGRLNKYQKELEEIKNNAQFLKEEHIKLLKNKFNEWDNMIFKIKIINIKENDKYEKNKNTPNNSSNAND